MDYVISTPNLILTFTLTIFHSLLLGKCTTFTFVNKCDATVWPAILSNSGSPPLQTTGFELPSGTARPLLSVPSGWSGRFWARTGCSFDALGHGSCATGDCGSGEVQCNGAGAAPPATLAEFALDGGGGKDFYDVSLVDGYNLPMAVEAAGGDEEGCATTGCAADLNLRCPAELKVGEGDEAAGCRSACEAFGRPEYCCSGEFGSPATCRATAYSEMFKSACPRAYSYAYDDASSIFTCTGAQEYTITFCPAASPSQKATTSPSPPATGATAASWGGESWLASLASGGANLKRTSSLSPMLLTITLATILAFVSF